jgi:hypothetical protein
VDGLDRRLRVLDQRERVKTHAILILRSYLWVLCIPSADVASEFLA